MLKKMNFTIMSFIFAAVMFTACGDSVNAGDDDHTHTWGAWTVTTPPNFTTTTAGEETRNCSGCGASETQTYPIRNIGDNGLGGGKIFYVADGLGSRPLGFTMTDTGKKAYYLEAAPNGLGTLGTIKWASTLYETTDIPGTGTAIGTGRNNTAVILNTDANAPAAKACNDYNNGKDDWFLPSKDELDELYKYCKPYFDLSQPSYSGLSKDANYWSSSQYDSNVGVAWQKVFGGSEVTAGAMKTSNLSAHAIRAF